MDKLSIFYLIIVLLSAIFYISKIQYSGALGKKSDYLNVIDDSKNVSSKNSGDVKDPVNRRNGVSGTPFFSLKIDLISLPIIDNSVVWYGGSIESGIHAVIGQFNYRATVRDR
jgi:hypothetical protein